MRNLAPSSDELRDQERKGMSFAILLKACADNPHNGSHATLNFFLPRVVSGDRPGTLSRTPRQEMKQEIRAQYGLDKPLFGQFVTYLAELSKGNLGMSFSYRRPLSKSSQARYPGRSC